MKVKKMKKENMKKENVINKDMTIKQLLDLDESLAEVLMGFGMFCVLCHTGEEESIEEAAMAHGIELDFLLEKLNEEYSAKRK